MLNHNNEPESFLLEKDVKSGFFSSFGFGHEINPKYYPVTFQNNNEYKQLSETEYALRLLEQHNLNPKVFCFAEKNDLNTTFDVKSNHWNWEVKPIMRDDVPDIPLHFLEGIAILETHDVAIRSIALATPHPREHAGEVVQTVCTEEIQNVMKFTRNTVLLLAIFLKKLSNFPSEQGSSMKGISLQELPDPVLLVRLSSTWIEIGRW